MAECLTCAPNKLVFALTPQQPAFAKLSLHNPTTNLVGFKVKTTSPNQYSVKPAAGVLQPGATWEATIVRAAPKELPKQGEKCKVCT